jgi:heme-degrading monooxygenase HmoA
MILEVAPLQVRAGHEPQFESAFLIAQGTIAGMPGHVSH